MPNAPLKRRRRRRLAGGSGARASLMSRSHGRMEQTDRLVPASRRCQLPMVETVHFTSETGTPAFHKFCLNDLIAPQRHLPGADDNTKQAVGVTRQFEVYNRATVLGAKVRQVCNYAQYMGAPAEATNMTLSANITQGERIGPIRTGDQWATEPNRYRPGAPAIAHFARVTIDPDSHSATDGSLDLVAERPNTSFKIMNPGSGTSSMVVTGTVGSWYPEFTVGEDDFAVSIYPNSGGESISEPKSKLWFHTGVVPQYWDNRWKDQVPPVNLRVEGVITYEITFDVVFHEPRTMTSKPSYALTQGYDATQYPNTDWTEDYSHNPTIQSLKDNLIAQGVLNPDGTYATSNGSYASPA